MNIRIAMTGVAAAVLTAGAFAAETKQFDALTDWAKDGRLTFADGVFTAKGRRVDARTQPFAVDPSKTYQFSVEVRRTPGAPPSYCYVGNWSISATGARLLPEQVMVFAGTDSVLAADAKKGAKEIVIKRPAKWRDDFKKFYWGVVFDARADLSDLPNMSYNQLMAAEADGETIKLTLRNPLRQDYPAGTATRFHSSGNGMYGGLSRKVLSEEWTTVTWKVKGIAPTGNPVTKWWHGTVQGAVRIIGNYDTASSMEFRNARLEVLD